MGNPRDQERRDDDLQWIKKNEVGENEPTERDTPPQPRDDDD